MKDVDTFDKRLFKIVAHRCLKQNPTSSVTTPSPQPVAQFDL